MKKDVLFLTGLFPKEIEKEIIENTKGAPQNAANVLQWNLTEGFDMNLETPVKLVNALFIGSYPQRYKKAKIKDMPFSHVENSKDINVGFCNLAVIKHFSRRHKINSIVKKWAKTSVDDKVFIAYAMTNSSMSAIKCVKKHNSKIKTCLVVPDLPQYMNMSNKVSLIYRIMKKLDWKKTKKAMKYVDSYALLTEQMSSFLGVNNYVVVEGIATNSFENVIAKKTKEKVVFYAGGLAEKYGIVDLVDAFKEIEGADYRLVLCGHGDAVEYIKTAQSEDNRIQYLGVLPREQILKLLVSSTVLVNPRKNTEEFTKYSFPSKILEYLSSGTPVVTYKLDGIPDEYDSYMYYVKGDTIDDLATTIKTVCDKPEDELREFGAVAKKFVLTEKNAKKQTEKILEFIEKV